MPLIRDLMGGRDKRSRRMPALRGSGTAAGVTVTPEKALQLTAVYSCVRLLSETGSMLPVHLYKRTAQGRTAAREHPIYRLLAHQPNPVIDSGEYWRQTLGWQLLRGNAATFVQRNRAGDPIALWPLYWTSVEPLRQADGQLAYQVHLADDEYAPLPSGGRVKPQDMLHYRAFGLGVEGLSPIGLARQSVGTAWAAQSYIGRFFDRDASPGGLLSVEGELSDEQFERLERQWGDLHEGFDRAHRLAILENGAKWEKVSLTPADAQFIETYKLGRAEIAGMYGVPPHMIGDVDRSTSWGSGIEQQSIGYVIYSLMPWLTRLERVTQRLFGDDMSHYLRFKVDALQRGDLAARTQAYAQGRQWGWYSGNDVRRKEDEDPVDGLDDYLQPLNMVPAGATPVQRAAARSRQQRALANVPAGAAMVALYPPLDVAAALAVPGGLPVEELHVTLAYLGEDLTEQQQRDAADVVRSVARQHDELLGSIGGLGQFPADADAGTPVYAPVDVPRLAELRHRLVEQLEAAGVPVAASHGFTPHLTLTYLLDGDEPPAPAAATPVRFGALTLAVGGDRASFQFTGNRSARSTTEESA